MSLTSLAVLHPEDQLPRSCSNGNGNSSTRNKRQALVQTDDGDEVELSGDGSGSGDSLGGESDSSDTLTSSLGGDSPDAFTGPLTSGKTDTIFLSHPNV